MKPDFPPSLLALPLLLLSSGAFSNMLFSDVSLSYLNGTHYKVGDSDKQVLTVEHASGHTWGDNFFFMDRLQSDNGDLETYFELSPRASLGWLFGHSLAAGPVQDVLLATTWEATSNPYKQFDNYLAGIGVTLKAPGFRFVKLNVYQAHNDLVDNDEQLTVNWALPFALGGTEFLYDGFVDWSSAQDDHAAEMNFTSQLKWNAGKLLNSASPFYIGVEYAYWHNKFGIKNVTENNPCLLVKWHF